MNDVWRFLVFNLGASLAAGLVAWGVVMLVLRLLGVRSAFLYAGFLALPLVKSVLVLLGLSLVLPWSGLLAWQFQALPPLAILPWILAWFVLAYLVYGLLVRQARRALLSHSAAPAGQDEVRLSRALAEIQQAYQQSPCCQAGETTCCISDQIPEHPRLLVSDRLGSPAALVEGGTPVIIFPRELVGRLADMELALALAHELNHFALRKPGGWSAGSLRLLALVSPVALLLADALHREEEKACDDLAVRILGTPEVYAGMLVKCYQFARANRRQGWQQSIAVIPELAGFKPFLSQRIERLLEPLPDGPRWYRSGWVTWPVWGTVFYLLFFARFGS